jgi:hypothetical protein
MFTLHLKVHFEQSTNFKVFSLITAPFTETYSFPENLSCFRIFFFQESGVDFRFLNNDFVGGIIKFGAFFGGVPFGLPFCLFGLTEV